MKTLAVLAIVATLFVAFRSIQSTATAHVPGPNRIDAQVQAIMK